MSPATTNPVPGLEGSLSAFPITDVLQLEHQSRFTGSLVVTRGGIEGRIFMQGGEAVHAEVGDLKGEDAFREIVSWTTGTFVAHANVVAVASSIAKGFDHLLLGAHVQLDERRTEAPAPRPPPVPAQRPAPPPVVERVRAISGVKYAVLFDRSAVVRGDRSPAAAALAAESLHLASTIASPLGAVLGLGELRQADVRSTGEQRIVIRSRDTFLAIAIAAGSSLRDVEAGVRKAVTAAPGKA